MATATGYQPKNIVPEQKVSPEDRQFRVSALLKQADQLVKDQKYEAALERVRKVYEYEPSNMYAHAYEERILTLKISSEHDKAATEVKVRQEVDLNAQIEQEVQRRIVEIHKQQEEENSKRKAQEQKEELLEQQARQASVSERKELVQQGISALETETMKRVQTIEQNLVEHVQHSLEEERQRIAEQTRSMIDELKSTLHVNNQSSVETEAVVEKMKKDIEDELARMKEQMKIQMIAKSAVERRSIQTEILEKISRARERSEEELQGRLDEERETIVQREHQKSKDRALEAYRSQVVLLTQLRIPENIQEALLRGLRIPLGITDAEHAEMVKFVGASAYVKAVKEAWKDGSLNSEESELLRNLGSLYHISPEQQTEISTKVRQELGVPSQDRVILVLDDEDYILQFLEAILKQTYERVLTAKSVEQAVQIMKLTPPSLLVCDVNLNSPSISGFTFCEKLKEGEYGESLKETPFIIMSAVADDFFVRAAKQLGAKAYLAKPFTREKLESTIKFAIS